MASFSWEYTASYTAVYYLQKELEDKKASQDLKQSVDVMLQPLFKQPVWLNRQGTNQKDLVYDNDKNKIPSQIMVRALSSISALHGSVLIVQLEIKIL